MSRDEFVRIFDEDTLAHFVKKGDLSENASAEIFDRVALLALQNFSALCGGSVARVIKAAHRDDALVEKGLMGELQKSRRQLTRLARKLKSRTSRKSK